MVGVVGSEAGQIELEIKKPDRSDNHHGGLAAESKSKKDPTLRTGKVGAVEEAGNRWHEFLAGVRTWR